MSSRDLERFIFYYLVLGRLKLSMLFFLFTNSILVFIKEKEMLLQWPLHFPRVGSNSTKRFALSMMMELVLNFPPLRVFRLRK